MKENKNKKVLIALSGGVDSSVSAFLLKKQGFNVTGVYMDLFTNNNKNLIKKSEESKKRAEMVARKIGIPFYVVSLKKEFKKKVIDYTVESSCKGLTPNPCVKCNHDIKFGLLLKELKKKKFDFLATGHYIKKKKNKNSNSGLFRGKDKQKDQSYFLWKLKNSDIEKIIFPLGDYQKEEVKKIAEDLKLPVLKIKESMEACFVEDSMTLFLKRKIETKEGRIVDINGKILGKHQGFWLYTIGQRKGLGLPGGPYFVVDKNKNKNEIKVSLNEKDLLKNVVELKCFNWISSEKINLPIKVSAQIRYRQKPSSAELIEKNNRRYLKFKKPQKAITPGQSAVFYRGSKLLGGAIIKKTAKGGTGPK